MDALLFLLKVLKPRHVCFAAHVLAAMMCQGLGPGTLRAELIARDKAVEPVLTLDDLDFAEAIWLDNSVRGLMLAE